MMILTITLILIIIMIIMIILLLLLLIIIIIITSPNVRKIPYAPGKMSPLNIYDDACVSRGGARSFTIAAGESILRFDYYYYY